MAILVAANGAFFFVKSVTRYPFPSNVIFHWQILALLLAISVIKIVLGIFTKKLVKAVRTVSVRFIANMMIIEGVMGIFVAISYGITPLVPFSIDAIVTTIVGILFMFVGLIYTIILGKIIVGRDPRVSTLVQITDIVKENKRVVGIGKLVIHDYGSQRKEATLEVAYDFAYAADIYDTNIELENKIYNELGIKVKIIPIREKVYVKQDDTTLGVPVIESGFSVKDIAPPTETKNIEAESNKDNIADTQEQGTNVTRVE
jgi:divalent metal cation (Fe/Co/Zn/Cd) transporter